MKKVYKKMDKFLLIMIILYSIVGLLAILSASSIVSVTSYYVTPYYFFIKQAVIMLIMYIIGFVVILRYPTIKYKKWVPLLIIGIIFLLFFLLSYGEFTNNAKSWIDLKFFSLQPSEFAKVIVIIYLAVYFGNYTHVKHNVYDFLKPIFVTIIIFLLIAKQPDLGTASIIAGITFLIFMSLPMDNIKEIKKAKLIAIIGLSIGVVLIFSGNFMLNEQQKSRLNFKQPCSRYTEKTGYQVCNGFIAINNGGFFGKGIGNSTQKYLYLPEAHTDFIFPIIIEEIGVLGGILLIFGYMLILLRILYLAKKSSNLRNSILCYGTFAFLLMHLLVNFLGIFALMPLTGVPVPFLSYGGSFIIITLTLMFIVLRVSVENETDKVKSAIRKI